MPFPVAFLEELSARNPIEEIVGQYVNLRRSGSNLFGLCPFHGEKTASFSVAPDKGIYYCFGCHKGGGVINFQMEIEGLSYPEAVRTLAKRAGLEVPDDEQYQNQYRHQERLWALCKEAARFFHDQLYSDSGELGRAYAEKRGLTKNTLTRFGIGFAPNTWNSLTDAMLKKGFTEAELKESGLVSVSQSKGNIYDRFRNRLMFPIIDIRGNVIGFGGRVMDDSTPKYLNSPESIVFEKRKNVFALNIAKKSKKGYLILVEGYMDAIALHQFGFDCAVASLGTSLTEEHALLLSRYTEQIVLIYDGDAAGQKATQRAIPILEKAGLRVKVLKMRDAKDPDEFLRKFGADRFQILLDDASNRIEYQLNAIKNQHDFSTDDDRIRFVSEAAEFLCTLGNAVQREVYGVRAAETASISPEAMSIEINKAFQKRKRVEKKKQEKQELSPVKALQPVDKKLHYDNIKSAMAEERIIAMLLSDISLFSACDDLSQNDFSSELLGRVYLRIKEHQNLLASGNVMSALDDFTSDEMAHIARICSHSEGPVSEQAFRDCVQIVKSEHNTSLVRASGLDEDMLSYRQKMMQKKGLK